MLEIFHIWYYAFYVRLDSKSNLQDRYLGFKECQDEVMKYLVNVEELDVNDRFCSSLMIHLDEAGKKFRIVNGIFYCHIFFILKICMNRCF